MPKLTPLVAVVAVALEVRRPAAADAVGHFGRQRVFVGAVVAASSSRALQQCRARLRRSRLDRAAHKRRASGRPGRRPVLRIARRSIGPAEPARGPARSIRTSARTVEHVPFDPAGVVARDLEALHHAERLPQPHGGWKKHERIADDVDELRVRKHFQDRSHACRVRRRFEHDATVTA